MYKKRDGTSGIRGQLYETKLISLIHFRTTLDNNIKDYTLATNVADIGTFDDICIRAKVKIKGRNKPVAVFIQAKHREGDKVQLTLNSKSDLAKWFSSYLSIRRLFKPSNKDVLFRGNFEEIESHFIMYTTAKADPNTEVFKGDYAEKLNSLIGTGDEGLQPCHKEEDIVFLCEIITKEQFAALAVQLAKFLSDNNKNGDKCQNKDNNYNDGPIMSMNDDLVLIYHVILAQKVLNVSEIKCKNEKEEHRVATFRADFFDNEEDFIVLFKDTLFIEMLEKRTLQEQELNGLLTKLFIKPLEISVLSSLIGNVVTFNDKKLKLQFVSKSMSDNLIRQLEKVDVLQSTVNEAIKLAAKDMLIKRDFKVPVAFGNEDLTIRGKEDNAEPSMLIASVIEKIKNKLVDLINASPIENLIAIDESIGQEFLQLNAGLASTVGNVLVTDKNSKYLKFADHGELEGFAKRLYTEVQSAIPNLHGYKFHMKVKTFPKLTFECDDDEDVEMLKDQVTVLAELMGEFICKEDNTIMPMNGTVLRYHVLVAQKAVEVSEIQSLNEDDEHRIASFRQAFFESDEEFSILFKRALCNEIQKIRKFDENEIDLAAKEILTSRSFKVPAAFGNKDLTIKIKKSKTERRLDHLKLKISELITKANADKVVTLDESLDDGLLKPNGGIAGIVGNILVAEENTKLMKITDNWEALGDLSKRLFIKLQNGIENLHEYKFDVKVKKFPKLSFRSDVDDENLAKDFLKKLLFFTNQADEKDVEKFLKGEIEDHQCLNVNNIRVTADAIFLQYHDLIQRWWMLKETSYLTKQSKHYEEALAAIVDIPLLTIISKMYMMKIKNNADYTFNEKALSFSKLTDQPPATIFVTESSALTAAKMVQSLKDTNFYIFDLEYVLDLPAKDYSTVMIELTKTNENKRIKPNLILIVCNNMNRNWVKRLESIAKVLENKRTIFVLNETLVETIKTYFKANNIATDEKCNLIQMTENSQKIILENGKVMFQDVEVSLDTIIDKTSMAFVEGEVLHKTMNNETIFLGKSNSNSNYEKVKHVYIDRRVSSVTSIKAHITATGVRRIRRDDILVSLNGIAEVLIAKPGMGKSTLLTHLSLKTKELHPKVWIIRINLLIHSAKFSKWQEKKTNIDRLETLKFFCEVLTEKENKTNDLAIELEETNGDVTLKSCKGDQWTVFELKMFLDYYNRKELIFLFDGYDEICPMYTDEVLALLTTVKNYPREHKMCVTSRSYDNIIATLEERFGPPYEIQDFSNDEQNEYLMNFWKSKIILSDLTTKHYDNLWSFMEFMNAHYENDRYNRAIFLRKNRETHQVLFMNVCKNFLNYLRKEITACPKSVVKTFDTLLSNCNNSLISMRDFDTPLHLYLFARYFQNQIHKESILPNRWNLEVNAFTVYDTFIETKLKIRFQQKNKIDLYNPDNLIIYDHVRAVFFAKHYKLGAYAVFYQDADKIFSGQELCEIKETIDKIKEGTEKTGLIHSVVNGIPQFIHMTFTEYFAVQYICNLLKTETTEEKQKSIWAFIINIVVKHRENVRIVLGYKFNTDDNLRAIAKAKEELFFKLLLQRGNEVSTCYPDDFNNYLNFEIRTRLQDAMNDDLKNFMDKLYNITWELTDRNLNQHRYTHNTLRTNYSKFVAELDNRNNDLSDDGSDQDSADFTVLMDTDST